MKIPLWLTLGIALTCATTIAPPSRPPVALTRQDNITILNERLADPYTSQLQELSKAAPHGVIRANDKIVKKYILPGPRAYHLMVMVGADEEFCPYCGMMREIYESVVETEARDKGYVVNKDNYPTFFLHVNGQKHQSLANILDITSVPEMFLITEFSMKCVDQDNKEISLERDGHRLERCIVHPDFWMEKNGRRPVQDGKDFKEELAKLLGENAISGGNDTAILSKRNPKLYIAAAVSLVVLGLGINYFDVLRDLILRYPAIVAVLGLISFWLSTSGFIYNLQHGMRLYGVDRGTGARVFLSRQGRNQYVLEGISFSAFTIVASLTFYGSLRLKPWAYATWHQKMNGWRKAILTGVILLGVFTTFVAYGILDFGVKIKHSYLKPTFFPYGMVWGSARNDRMYGI